MKKLTFIVVFLIGQWAFAHGETSLGPHNGYIRMPGAFHTEVVPEGNNKFKVYLLDIEFKNPTLQKSKLVIKIEHKSKLVAATCNTRKDYYLCKLPKGLSLKKGKLFVNAVREELVGAEVIYDLPFNLKIENHDHH
ncbi:MAG: hypothetical protein A2Z20_11300 [Bdellovibrionales bacterium RBG_16_40_8]|nr:MAG: hypothetical protein A2Z20_11300 [Bdellovibrionales bacterium RBG_16_40_8]